MAKGGIYGSDPTDQAAGIASAGLNCEPIPTDSVGWVPSKMGPFVEEKSLSDTEEKKHYIDASDSERGPKDTQVNISGNKYRSAPKDKSHHKDLQKPAAANSDYNRDTENHVDPEADKVD